MNTHTKYYTDIQFDEDIQRHQIKILMDSGVYRHIRYARPDSGMYRFDIITWPGYLAIAGDMGEYVFSRTHDMFTFFRSDSHRPNFSYWAEKCCAASTSCQSPIYTFDRRKTTELVKEWVDNWCDEHSITFEERTEVEMDVLESLEDALNHDESLHSLYHWAYDYVNVKHRTLDFSTYMTEYSSRSFQSFDFQYEWICHAIPWAIQQYDAATSATP